MKAINKICQVLAVVFGLAALVFYFLPFANLGLAEGAIQASGLQVAFGGKLVNGVNIARSADILFCFWLTLISTVLSGVTFFKKSKGLTYVVSGLTLGAGIYLLVIALSNPWKFIDTRPLTESIVSGIGYEKFVLFTAIAVLLSAVAAIAYMLIADYLDVIASKGSKKFLIKRIINFFKDYKSECKKIVWPNWREVAKNTGIVLVMCAAIGIVIWLVDLGLGSLLDAVWKK